MDPAPVENPNKKHANRLLIESEDFPDSLLLQLVS
mgnify:CR=1 FL=1